MNIAEMLNNVQFLVDSEGNKKSVMLDYRLWEKLLLFVEDVGKTIISKRTAKEKNKSFLRTARSNAVKATLDPKGRNVIIDKKFGAPTITKDGVTVAKEIELEDAVENMGAAMVREVASRTSDVAGDGTTTATVLSKQSSVKV